MQPVARSSNGTPLFECVCPDCGKIRHADKRKLGKPCISCANKRRSTHGLSNTRIYALLQGMKIRCTYPSATNFEYYGGRGITICDEWLSNPAAFAEWALENGYRKGVEIDRIDNDGPYAPWNCRFVSHAKNSRKRSNGKCDLTTAGRIRNSLAEGVSIKQAAAIHGVPYMVAWHISKGNTWDANKGID